jgi:hypothetical protein
MAQSVINDNDSQKGAVPLTTLVAGTTKGGSITVPLTSCLTGLESVVLQLNFFLFVKQTNPNQSNRRSMVQ